MSGFDSLNKFLEEHPVACSDPQSQCARRFKTQEELDQHICAAYQPVGHYCYNCNGVFKTALAAKPTKHKCKGGRRDT